MLNMKVLTGKELGALRVFTFGGEGFPKSALRKLYEMYAPRVRFVNVYGPTECTCICSFSDIADKDFEGLVELAHAHSLPGIEGEKKTLEFWKQYL